MTSKDTNNTGYRHVRALGSSRWENAGAEGALVGSLFYE